MVFLTFMHFQYFRESWIHVTSKRLLILPSSVESIFYKESHKNLRAAGTTFPKLISGNISTLFLISFEVLHTVYWEEGEKKASDRKFWVCGLFHLGISKTSKMSTMGAYKQTLFSHKGLKALLHVQQWLLICQRAAAGMAHSSPYCDYLSFSWVSSVFKLKDPVN